MLAMVTVNWPHNSHVSNYSFKQIKTADMIYYRHVQRNIFCQGDKKAVSCVHYYKLVELLTKFEPQWVSTSR